VKPRMTVRRRWSLLPEESNADRAAVDDEAFPFLSHDNGDDVLLGLVKLVGGRHPLVHPLVWRSDLRTNPLRKPRWR
jgi:hypothetical protein